MANEQPTNKSKAKSAFLKQANHFARLGTATDQDVAALIDSMSAMLASVLKKPISIQIQGVDAATAITPTATPSEPDAHIDLMGLNVRAMHALKSVGLVYASHIATLTETQLAAIRGLGKKTVPSIIEALRAQGLTLAGEA